jgi:two-component system, OmpR family, sensor kinase
VDQQMFIVDHTSAYTVVGVNIPARRTPDEEAVDIVATAAHDLRTSLTAIKGFTQLVQRGLDRDAELDRAQMAQRLERIDVIATQMNAIVSYLLDTARPASNRTCALQRQTLDLGALAREVAIQNPMSGESHRVLIDAPQPVTGHWDRTLLIRAVGNLVSNAMEYSPRGSEIILAVRRVGDVTGQWAVLSVTDYGSGIPPGDLPHVVEAFSRGENVDPDVEGIGLGLAIVQRVVDQHSGELAISSEVGRGTTMTIRLPIDDEPG